MKNPLKWGHLFEGTFKRSIIVYTFGVIVLLLYRKEIHSGLRVESISVSSQTANVKYTYMPNEISIPIEKKTKKQVQWNLSKVDTNWCKKICPFLWDVCFIERSFNEKHSFDAEAVVRCPLYTMSALHHVRFTPCPLYTLSAFLEIPLYSKQNYFFSDRYFGDSSRI